MLSQGSKTRKKRKLGEKKTLVGMLTFSVLWKINNCVDVFFNRMKYYHMHFNNLEKLKNRIHKNLTISLFQNI